MKLQSRIDDEPGSRVSMFIARCFPGLEALANATGSRLPGAPSRQSVSVHEKSLADHRTAIDYRLRLAFTADAAPRRPALRL